MQVMRTFVDQHPDTYGVEPICNVLQIAPSATGDMPHSTATQHGDAPAPNAMTC
jgi:hypothetical protein